MRSHAMLAVFVIAVGPCAGIHAASLFPDGVVPAPQDPQGAARADFDLDGHEDLAVAGRSSAYVSVFFGNGDGTFVETRIDQASVQALAVGDFNEDGTPDLALTRPPDTLLVLPGHGDRTFGSAASFIVRENVPCPPEGTSCFPSLCPVCYLPGVYVGDFDEDGHQDLMVGDAAASFSDVPPFVLVDGGHTILFGDGSGSFAGLVDLRGGSGLLATLGDFNGDEHLDLARGALVDGTARPVEVLTGNGTGRSSTAGPFREPRRLATSPRSIRTRTASTTWP